VRFGFERFPYGKKIIAALGGTATAQAINILGALAITRIYAPAEFGLFASWLVITNILTNCLSHMLEHTFGLEPDGDERSVLVMATVAVSLVTAMAVAVFVLIFYWLGIYFFNDSMINIPPVLWWLLMPQSLGATLLLVWQSWAANDGNLRYLVQIRISQAAFIAALQITAGIMQPNVSSLAVAQTAGVLLSVGMCWYLMPLRIPVKFSVLLRHMRYYWSKYRRFPLLALPANLVGVTADRLPVLLIAGRFGAEIAGYYALVVRVMATPIALLGGAVLDVFKRSAAEERNATGSCQHAYKRTFYLLLILSAILVVVVWFFASEFFVFFFGEQWAIAGNMVLWLLPMSATIFVASPLSYVFFIMQKQGVNLCWQICLCCMAVWVFMNIDYYKQSILVYAICYAALNFVYLILSCGYAKNKGDSQ